MRVGIINFHGSYNYGSLLLTYALQKTIEDRGHEVKIINYLSSQQRNQYNLPILVSRHPIKRFIERLYWLPYINGMRLKYEKFDKFRNSHLNLTEEYYGLNELKSIDDSFDVIISGSDQIWNLGCYDFSWAYYLTFSNKAKKVSYAPSIGPGKNWLDDKNRAKVVNALKDYQYISVRDSNTQHFVEYLINIKPEIVLDPTMLLTKKEWADLSYKTHGSLLAKAITCKLGVTEKDLQNKLLILDGFDEIKYYSDSNDLLNSFLLQIRNIQGLHVIITSRENYINIKEIKFQNIVRLRPFDEEKIKKYAEKITGCNKFNKKSIGDTEVYGIPVVLYMALTSGIDISKEENRCSAYEKIFSIDGGIFDRFATESDPGYDEYASHDIAFIKEAFYNILCKTAYVMFENEFRGIFIDQEKYDEIINEESSKMPNKTSLWYDFPIDNLYEKGNRIEFVHKSIYEYFAAEYLYKKIIDYTLWPYNFSQNKHHLSNKKRQRLLRPRMIKTGKILLASFLKRGSLSIEILDFLKYKIHMLSCKDLGKLYFENVFCDMIINGMMSGNKYYEDGYILENEAIVFSNILKFLHLWVDTNTDVIMFKEAVLQKIRVYLNLVSNLKECSKKTPQFISATSKLDLSNFDLRGCDFSNITVPSDTNFSNSILTNVTFNNSILAGCKFENTTAIGAIMQNANLKYTNFRNANVIKANFSGADITHSNFACSSVAEAILTGTKTEEADFRDVSGMDTAIYTTEYKGMILNDSVWEDINIHNGRYSNSLNASRRK